MDNFQKLFDLIGVLARRRYKAAEQRFSALGLNHTEARLLTILHQEKGVATQDALSNRLFVDRSNAGRGLKNLEWKGCIKRSENEGNKKTKLVEITATGRQTIVEISKIRKKMAQSFFGDLTKGDAGTIVDLLQDALADEDDEASLNEFGDETVEEIKRSGSSS